MTSVKHNTYRQFFPSLNGNNQDVVYLDSAASTQVPEAVLSSIQQYYSQGHANVHRASHRFARQSTNAFELARKTIAEFIGAKASNVILTSGSTQASNIIASGLSNTIQAGDEIWVSELEHHSNLVPWQQLALRCKAIIKPIPVLENGDINLDFLRENINERCKIIAIAHVSNSIGAMLPVPEICRLAHQYGAKVVVDGAQAVAHLDVDVKRLGCDYYFFSGHKLYAPTGIGALYGTTEALESLAPSIFGGEMINHVSMQESSWNSLPYRLEAGTPNIVGAIGLAAAVDFLAQFPIKERLQHERSLLNYTLQQLSQHPSVELVGKPMMRVGSIAFNLTNIHPQDAATLFDQYNIALRCGHHCAMPLNAKLAPQGSIRLSLGIYNSVEDIDLMLSSIDSLVELFDE
ncbi:cysteine desulfurase [Agarivorans sp. TSD2052]|uniref:aminotransferase class V-fold PLP-dependent enzyme n=1 Tax=Agarivorans sp. TSD2052 TaxID=2937286 RepID=UPI00200C728F|nr:cysteine desulfurase [Agarivorans sp. TSD2052]UPW20245.1 cysteine desulfurase [Agarivorans sp. TSD2052]